MEGFIVENLSTLGINNPSRFIGLVVLEAFMSS
jgi:hypothetical protein